MIGRILLFSVIFFLFIIPNEADNGWPIRRRRRCRIRVNCAVCSWSGWSSCSANPCGWGTQTRTRTKTRTEACGGSCPYQMRQTRWCSSGCRHGGKPSYGCCVCRPGFSGTCCEKRICSRVNCTVSSWSGWSSCTYNRYDWHRRWGTQTRTRTKTSAEKCGGTCPYQMRQTKPCRRYGNNHSPEPVPL